MTIKQSKAHHEEVQTVASRLMAILVKWQRAFDVESHDLECNADPSSLVGSPTCSCISRRARVIYTAGFYDGADSIDKYGEQHIDADDAFVLFRSTK